MARKIGMIDDAAGLVDDAARSKAHFFQMRHDERPILVVQYSEQIASKQTYILHRQFLSSVYK